MKIKFVSALAAATVAAGTLAGPAYAQSQEATQFRSVEARAFTAEDMQRYGLDESQAQRAMDLQAQGYEIVALTPEEAEAYQAGAISQTEWILIGIGVLIILAVA